MHLQSLLILALVAFSATSTRAELTLDTSFNPPLPAPQANWSGYGTVGTAPGGAVYVHKQDTDGRVVRVKDDGALDTGFNPTLTTHLANTSGFLFLRHADSGALLAEGVFLDGAQPTLLARLTPSGAVDPGFTPVRAPHPDTFDGWVQETNDALHYIVEYGIDGGPPDYNRITGFTVVRATDGQPVPNFPPNGENLEVSERWKDGTFLVHGRRVIVGRQNESLVRYLPNFQRDPTFDAPTFAIATDDDLWFSIWDGDDYYFVLPRSPVAVTMNGQPAAAIYRLLDNGSPDPAFTPFQAPPLQGRPAYWTSLEEMSDGDPGDQQLLVATSHGPYGDPPRYAARFHLLDAETGARNTAFDVVVEMVGTDDDAYGELSGEEVNGVHVRRALIHVSPAVVTVDGRAVPEGAELAVFAMDGTFVRFDMREEGGAVLQGFDEETQELVTAAYTSSAYLSDGSELVYWTWPELTHVDGEPVEGLVLLRADGTWDRSVNIVPSYPAETNYLQISAEEVSPGKVLLTGSFTAINGVPRPGVARLLFTPAGPAEWTGTYGLVDDPVALATDDSDDDGVPDLVELAFRLNPLEPDATNLADGEERGLPAPTLASPSSPRLRLRFLRRRDRDDLGLTYAPQFSSGLAGPWVGGAELSTEVVDDTWEIVTVEDSAAPVGAMVRMGRIVVGL